MQKDSYKIKNYVCEERFLMKQYYKWQMYGMKMGPLFITIKKLNKSK